MFEYPCDLIVEVPLNHPTYDISAFCYFYNKVIHSHFSASNGLLI